jgi:phage-related protein
MGSSLKDLASLPEDIQHEFLRALLMAELYGKADYAEPMKGFPGGKVIDIKADYEDNCTYRCVYTIQYPNIVYVLHVFKKKSTQGIATPEADLRTIRFRLAAAKIDNDERQKQRRKQGKA